MCHGPYNCGIDILLYWFEECVVGSIWWCGCSSSSKSWFDKRRFWHNAPAKSLVDKRRFRQRGPASQHVRRKPTENKSLVDCFALNWQNSTSSPLTYPYLPNLGFLLLQPAPIPQFNRRFIAALIYYWIDLKKLWLDWFGKVVVLAVVVVVHPPYLGLIKEGFGIISQPHLWLIKEGFSRMGQPVNTSGGNQLKTNL